MCRKSETPLSSGFAVIAVLVCAAVSVVADMAMANQQTAASIIGQVKDESGAVLPGVTVTATSPALQLPQVTSVTDEQGEYRLTPLPIGTYEVVYELAGFQIIRQTDVRLTTGFVAKLDVALKIGGVAETVTVSGLAPVVDVTTTATATHLTRETLESAPSGRLGYISILGQAAGVRASLDAGGSAIEEGGAQGFPQFVSFGQNSESWQLLEGVVTNSPKRSQTGQFIDYAAIEETRVQTVGAGADMPSPGIQVVSIVKSGGNEFHGTGLWTQTSSRFQASNVDDGLRALGIRSGGNIIKRQYLAGDVGGRIVPNKLWFYAGANHRSHHYRLLGLLKPDGSPVNPYEDMGFLNAKLSYQMTPANRLIFFQQYGLVDRVTNGSLSLFSPWDSRSLQAWNNNTVKGEWQAVVGNSLVTSVQYGYFEWDSLQQSPLPLVPATLDIFTQLGTGSNWTRLGENAFEYNHHARGTLSWYRPGLLAGNHEFRSGFDYLLPTINRNRASRGEALDYQLVFNNGTPFQISTNNFPVDPLTKSHYLGIYGEDQWSIGRRLTLVLGLRYAHDNGFVPAQCREAAAFVAAECFPKVQFKIWNTFAPRLQAAYDLSGRGKSVIKGGWARFDRMRLLDPEILQANRNAPEQRTWLWRDLNGNRLYEPGEVNLDPNGPDFVALTGIGVSSSPAYAVPNPNEKEPKQDQFSLAMEQEVIANLGVRVTGVYARSFDNYRLQNNRRPYEVYNIPVTRPDPGIDGRVGTSDDPGTTLTYYEYPTSLQGLRFIEGMLINDPNNIATFKSIELAAVKRMSNGWHLMASYTTTKKAIPFGNVDAVAYEPNQEFNRADDTRDWLGKVAGSYLLPGGVTVSANFEHRSGDPWQRTVLLTGGRTIPSVVLNAEPFGARRLPNLNLLDFRIDKKIRLNGEHRLGVLVNLYNALNANTVVSVTNRAGASFARPTAIVKPRILEFGASYNF